MERQMRRSPGRELSGSSKEFREGVKRGQVVPGARSCQDVWKHYLGACVCGQGQHRDAMWESYCHRRHALPLQHQETGPLRPRCPATRQRAPRGLERPKDYTGQITVLRAVMSAGKQGIDRLFQLRPVPEEVPRWTRSPSADTVAAKAAASMATRP